MKGKVLLGCMLLVGGLGASYQSQVKQTVSAEANEAISSQQETSTKTESSSSVANAVNEVPMESTVSESKIPEAVAKVQTPLPAEKAEENYQFSVVKNQTTEEFIQTIGKDAQQIAWNEGLYASVMIAQAILESGSGNSQLARPPHHNLFGIKGSYQGKQVTFNTQEDKGNGQLHTIQSAFRQYPSYRESLEDYAALLKNGISRNAGFYQATWKEHASNYQVATKALTGKYATDTSYDKKLNALIETYRLTNYDLEPKTEESTDLLITSEISSESIESSVEQATNETNESIKTEKPTIIKSQKKHPVITIPPVTQRPAKELAGNRIAQ